MSVSTSHPESVIDVEVEYKPNKDGSVDSESFLVHEQVNGKAVIHEGGFFGFNDVDGKMYLLNQDDLRRVEIGVPRERTDDDS